MGVQKPFGKTWWGNAWVKAMERIDYNTNRLPRGRRYANNGSVLDVQLEGRDVLASVRGSRPKPYRVKTRLNELKASETTRIKRLVADNIPIATDLSLGKLPESMLDLLEREGNLPPSSTDDMAGKPDYYTPNDRLSSTGPSPRGQSEPEANGNEPTAPPIDLAFPAVDMDALYSLLPDSPLFCSQGSFRKILIQAYHQARRAIEDLIITEDDIILKNTEIYLVQDSDGNIWASIEDIISALGAALGGRGCIG